jgi:hypothetical protein
MSATGGGPKNGTQTEPQRIVVASSAMSDRSLPILTRRSFPRTGPNENRQVVAR